MIHPIMLLKLFVKNMNQNLKYLRIDKFLPIILVVSIIASSATLIYILVTKTGENFTEFYLLDSNGTASNYPTDITVGDAGEVIICIVNQEYETVNYILEVKFNGTLIHKESIFLVENEKWESPFTFKATNKGENKKLEFLLYNDQQIEAYRKLHLWINVT